jgi:hypothetical protein
MTCRMEIQHNLLPHTGTNDGLVARYSSDDESSDGEGEGSEEDGELHHGWRLRTADEADGTLPPYVRERLSDQSAYIQKLEAQNLDLQEVRSTCHVHDCRFVSTCCYRLLSSYGHADVAAIISGSLSLFRYCRAEMLTAATRAPGAESDPHNLRSCCGTSEGN